MLLYLHSNNTCLLLLQPKLDPVKRISTNKTLHKKKNILNDSFPINFLINMAQKQRQRQHV